MFLDQNIWLIYHVYAKGKEEEEEEEERKKKDVAYN
jgi:hypothetical protein